MRYFLPFIFCIIFSGSAFSSDDSDEYGIPTYKTYKFKKIKKVTVTVGSRKNDYRTSGAEDCREWMITQKDGLYFFKHAKEFLPWVSALQYDISSCSADGTIELSDGSKGVWEIFPTGAGRIKMNLGKANESYIRVYCKICDEESLGYK